MHWTLWAAGDFMPVKEDDLQYENSPYVDKKHKDYVQKHDLSILNLETPLVTTGMSAVKVGPVQKGDPKSISILSELGIDAVNLANNHIGDFGSRGIGSTMKLLEKYGIQSFGAGKNFEQASRPIVINVGGIRIGLIGCCEVQFGSARQDRPGVYAPDFYQLLDNIYKFKQQCDVIIVSVHAAEEWSPWPSPNRVMLFRTLVDNGVSVVLGHHSHMPQGYEKYEPGIIFYGLGNFWSPFFRSWGDRENYDWGLCPTIHFDDGSIVNFTIRMSKMYNDRSIKFFDLVKNSRYQNYIHKCNEPLSDFTLLQGIWQEVSLRLYEYAYCRRLGWDRNTLIEPIKEFFQILVMKSGLLKKYKRSRLKSRFLSRWLFLSCYSQHDSITTALGVLGGELRDVRNKTSKDYVDQMMPWLNTTKPKE